MILANKALDVKLNYTDKRNFKLHLIPKSTARCGFHALNTLIYPMQIRLHAGDLALVMAELVDEAHHINGGKDSYVLFNPHGSGDII